MTRFIQQSACEGRRPHGVVPDRLRSRPRLLSRLLEDRGALSSRRRGSARRRSHLSTHP